MSEPTMYDKKKFDKRLIDRHLKGGALEMARISKEDLQAHLDELPDLATECEPVSIKQPILSDNDADVDAD